MISGCDIKLCFNYQPNQPEKRIPTMEQYQLEQIAMSGQRINDPVQAQQIYSALSNNPELRMQFLANHADLLGGGVMIGGLTVEQYAEIEAIKAEQIEEENEQIFKEYERMAKQRQREAESGELTFSTSQGTIGGY